MVDGNGQLTGMAPGTTTVTASLTTSNGLITGLSAGTADIEVSGGVPTLDWHFEGFDACGDAVGTCNGGNGDSFDVHATVTVKPKIASISPAQGAVGDTIAVTIAGVGMTTGATVNAGSGITATVTSSSDTQVQANFVISASASGGNVNVTVTANGQTSNSMTFFVQVPTSLSVVSVSVLPTGSDTTADCCLTSSGTSTGTFGINLKTTYQIIDQRGGTNTITLHQASIYEPQEAVTACGDNCSSASGDIGPTRIAGTSKYAGTNGQFVDSPFGVCAAGAFSNETISQSITILVGSMSYTVRSSAINSFVVSSSSSGHGTISNRSDISGVR